VRDGKRQAGRIGHEMDVTIDRPERSQGKAAQGDPGRTDDPVLEASMAPDPGEVRRVRPASK
jgi:hypothetical protein